MATRRQDLKVPLVKPNYDGLPITVLTQRIAEIDSAIEVIGRLRLECIGSEGEDWETKKVLFSLGDSESKALLSELEDDRKRYVDALKKGAYRSEFFQ